MRAPSWLRNLFRPHASADELRSINKALAALIQLGERTMSAITDFAARQKEFNDRQAKAVQGITDDVKFLSDKLTAIQNSPGTLSAEDQAALDEALARSEAVTTKLEALDSQTPPTPPVE